MCIIIIANIREYILSSNSGSQLTYQYMQCILIRILSYYYDANAIHLCTYFANRIFFIYTQTSFFFVYALKHNCMLLHRIGSFFSIYSCRIFYSFLCIYIYNNVIFLVGCKLPAKCKLEPFRAERCWHL